MPFNINEIKTNLIFGGARPNLFSVQITFPQALDLDGKSESRDRFKFMCKASQIPASTVEPINVDYFGRQIKVAGNRTFEDWTVTIINDEDFLIRRTLEDWSQAINDHLTNLRSRGASAAPADYKGRAEVWQYSKAEGTLPVRKYVFEGIFPTTIAAIPLAWGTNNTIEEFETTFAYDHWELSTVEVAPPTT
jgi:hypothetical protein